MIWIALLISLTFSMGFVCGCVWASRDRFGDHLTDGSATMAGATAASSYGSSSSRAVLDAAKAR